jgi:hypothetical protein
MVEIGTLDVSGNALGNGPDIGDKCFGIALVEAFIAFSQGFRNDARQGLAGSLGDSLGETVGFWVFHVKASSAFL